MNDKRKNILLGVLVVGVISMTVAFAALATNLRISGTANTAATKWNIHFQNWVKRNPETVNGHNNTAVSPAANALTMADNSNVTKVEGINVTLNQPGDTARYTFEIINEGTIDAKLSNFTPSITNGNSNVIEYTVECKDSKDNSTNIPTGNEITTNSVLQANGGLAYCLLEVKYKDQTNAQTPGQSQVYEQSAINATISATWTWVQDDGGSSPAPVSWDKYYTPTQTSGGATLPDNSQYWIQENTTSGTKEECGVFPSGTVCMTNNPSGYALDGEYVLGKKTEMEQAGASCSVNSSNVKCSGAGVNCYIRSSGSVSCDASGSSHTCSIGYNGSIDCH